MEPDSWRDRALRAEAEVGELQALRNFVRRNPPSVRWRPGALLVGGVAVLCLAVGFVLGRV
jgi:hypothetical protein